MHFHVLATDGLYERQPDGALTFLRARAPTSDELTALVQRVAARVQRLVGKPSEAAEPITLLPVLKVCGAPPRESALSLAVEHDGFHLHADVVIEAASGTPRSGSPLCFDQRVPDVDSFG